ncbi:MAG TPA: stalk domain-containing protein, partial [Clostridia bacterium]|nr:stalk domain-containing protein [Clostridia bacterium]
SIAYGKGLFVTVGDKGIILVSKDLKKWDNIEVNYDQCFDGVFKTVLFNGQIFVAAMERNIFYSKDGYHWDSVKVMGYNDKSSNSIVITLDEGISYGATNGKTFVLSGEGVLLYSKDGRNWTKHPDAHKIHGAAYGEGTVFSNVIYDGKKYISMCEYVNEREGGNKNLIYTSVDGITWDITEYEGPTCVIKYSREFLTYNGSKYYISSYDYNSQQNKYYESDDLKNWKNMETKLRSEFYHINNVAYELGDGIYTFENGKEILQYQAASNQTLNSMCTGNGKVVVVGTNGLILVCNAAEKSRKWTLVSNGTFFKGIYSAAANKTCIVAVGQDGQIIKSTDGVKWQIVKTSIGYSLCSVIYDGTYFIAVGEGGTLARSKDGSSWTLLRSNTVMDLYSVKKLNNKYIAVGDGAILYSKDSTNWKLVCGIEKGDIIDESFSGVTCKNSVYYAISNKNSLIYTSKDGVNWKQTHRLKKYGGGYYDFAYYKGRFVLYGQNMSISKDMKTETITREGFISSSEAKYIKMNLFKDYLLIGVPDGNILFSPDGLLWQEVGKLKMRDSINSFVEFKGSIYGFTSSGVVIHGVKKGSTALNSDITVSDFNGSTSDSFKRLKSQPVFRNGTMLLAIDTISGIIGCDWSYDKKNKTAVISEGKKNIRYTVNSSYALVNGKKAKIPKKTEAIGSSLYVPAQFTFNILGYTFNYDSSKRRIDINFDYKPKNNCLSFKQVLKSTDGSPLFRSISYNGKIYLAITEDGEIFSSKNSTNWAQTAQIEGEFSKVLWNGKRFIAAGGTGNLEGLIYVSEDGLNWRKGENIPVINSLYTGAVGSSGRTADEIYTGKLLKRTVLLSSDGVLTSEDGLKWNKSTDAKTKYFRGLCWYKGVYYSICEGKGIVYYSADGLKWNYYKTSIPINKIFSSGGTLWAVNDYWNTSNSAKLYKSKDGKNWSYVNKLPGSYIECVFYAGNKYIFWGYSNAVNHGFAMVSGGGDLWDFASVPSGMGFTNGVFRYGKLTIVSTNKGLFTLTVK